MILELSWKSYSVNLAKVRDYFKTNLSSNFDGLVATEDNLIVMFVDNEMIADDDISAISSYWDSLTEHSFDATLPEIVQDKLMAAMLFGNDLIRKFAIENVLLGITQADKTVVVSNYMHKLSHYLSTGSLYASIEEVDRMLADDTKGDLSPFVTNDRLNTYKSKIQEYLGI